MTGSDRGDQLKVSGAENHTSQELQFLCPLPVLLLLRASSLWLFKETQEIRFLADSPPYKKDTMLPGSPPKVVLGILAVLKGELLRHPAPTLQLCRPNAGVK